MEQQGAGAAVDVLLPEGPVPGEWAWSVEAIERAGTGPELAWELATGDPDRSGDEALLAAVVGFQRIAAWAAAGAARAAAALSERESMRPDWPVPVTVADVTADELAPALGCSRRAARRLVTDGRAWSGVLAATGDALARGEIDVPRARVLTDALAEQAFELAWEVEAAVLPGAAGRTAAQLARDVAKALIALDPAGAGERTRAAEGRRRLDRPRVLPDAMAGIWAVLPAADATRVDTVIDRLARAARSAGDPRTLDQLRVDLLVDLVLGRTCPHGCGGVTGAGEPVVAGCAGVDGVAADPALADTCSADAHRAPSRRSPVRAEIHVTVPFDVLAGLADGPGFLAGYGPIPASVARDLARDGTWRRILTDPATGAVLEVGRTRYRPPAEIADHVRTRDRWCASPGCSARADICDLDHTAEWVRDRGPTAADNLGPLCRRDHLVKTHGGFDLCQVEPGVFELTTPLGRRYRVQPGLDLPYRRIRPESGPGASGPALGDPPF